MMGVDYSFNPVSGQMFEYENGSSPSSIPSRIVTVSNSQICSGLEPNFSSAPDVPHRPMLSYENDEEMPTDTEEYLPQLVLPSFES